MGLTRRHFTALAGAALGGCSTMPDWLAGKTARFEPTWESLAANYRAPEWFRDAKLGLWAHWSAQCVPEQGDWYARKMYIQGERDYDHHLRNYGHPSQSGFMEIDNLWTAERWQPEALMRRYVAAGAKYFVALANHHDNFDNYTSRHHAWNSVNIGPKKDIVGIWSRLARRAGLKFGVSNHSGHAWNWMQTAYGYDAEGPLVGVRYDAYRLKKSDGVGKWWEGLDPQELYAGPSIVIPDGITSVAEMHAWHDTHDQFSAEIAPPQNPEFVRRWTLRCLDLMDSYNPDLVYFDNWDLPLGQAGLDVTAHYYNTNMARNGGRLECVVNGKNLSELRRHALVEDVERGLRTDIMPTPWQTDTCIGDWHYDRSIYEEHRYKTVTWVVHALCDIVSKNGNLLLNIPLRGDGSIDSDEEKFLDGLAAWMAVNSDAIFATRPWRSFGEGPSRAPGGQYNENKHQFAAADIRFTQKNGTLYALVLGWPDGGRVQIATLAEGGQYSQGSIARVELLGSSEPLTFRRDTGGLNIALPQSRNGEIAYALKIDGSGIA